MRLMMDHIFDAWPTVADMARDIGKKPVTVRSWRNRGSIPGEYDLLIIERAKLRGVDIRLEDLAQARAARASQAEA